jgi:exodeoxyribonuclease VII small subunit
MTFSDDMAELQEIVERLDAGDMPLEESLALFERGVTLISSCKKFLESAKQRVTLLSGISSDTEGSTWDPLGENPDEEVEGS